MPGFLSSNLYYKYLSDLINSVRADEFVNVNTPGQGGPADNDRSSSNASEGSQTQVNPNFNPHLQPPWGCSSVCWHLDLLCHITWIMQIFLFMPCRLVVFLEKTKNNATCTAAKHSVCGIFTTAKCQKGSDQDPEKLWRGNHGGRCQFGPWVLVPAAICWVSFACLMLLYGQIGKVKTKTTVKSIQYVICIGWVKLTIWL